MLALTTNPGPRNLLIERAFLGLSTITSERPWPPPAPFSESGAVLARRLGFGVDFDAGGFRVLGSAEGLELAAD
jgi:hypothetical protein